MLNTHETVELKSITEKIEEAKKENKEEITLKVKSDVEDGTKGSVELSNVRASTPDDEIGGSNISTTITVGSNNQVD